MRRALTRVAAPVAQAMFERMLRDEAMQADQWKIYPTQVVPWTKIKQWYEAGSYVPYPHEQMYELLVQVKSRVVRRSTAHNPTLVRPE